MKRIAYALTGLAVLAPSLASAYMYDIAQGYGMMGSEHGEGVMFFMAACMIVWIVVGILAGVWLWQRINKK